MLAPAKVNLMLHVTGKRADGYHLLQSLVMFADIGDDVSLTPSDDFSLIVTGEFASHLHGENLITKVAHAFDARGFLTLSKNLPVGSGLGGGSADAAAAIRLLSLPTKGEEFGSDIPACLHAAPLWMEGVGERITPVSIPFDVAVLLVNPRREVYTKAVYQRLAPPYAAPMKLPSQFTTLAELLQFLEKTHNALKTPATQMEPMIGTVIKAITALPSCLLSRMSGSGGTCFGIFPTQDACINAARALQTAHPDWWVRATKLQGNHG